MSITVLKPGLQTTIQSRPRSGMRHLGVPASGAADSLSLALANRLVGNTWDAAGLECTLLGPTLRFNSDCAFALVGATMAIELNGISIRPHATCFAAADDVLVIGAATQGARMYLAVAGGIVAEDVLGSTSTYIPAALGGLEGRALIAGDELICNVGTTEATETPAEFRPPMLNGWAMRACEAQEFSLLDADSQRSLFESNWQVDQRADRMGSRLAGGQLNVESDGRMPSAAVFPGTVQCPEDGAPYLLSVDAGTVGGYPRVAQVARADRHLLGQLRPGDHLRLLRREPDAVLDELEAKFDYWCRWLPDIHAILS